MIFRQLNKNSDWTFGKGLNNFAKEQEAIKLNIKTRLHEWKYNCFFDRQKGIDYYARLEKNQKEALKADITSIISSTDGVLSVLNLDVILDSQRKFTANYQIQTEYSVFTDFIGL